MRGSTMSNIIERHGLPHYALAATNELLPKIEEMSELFNMSTERYDIIK